LGLLSVQHRPLTISLLAATALISYSNLSVSAGLPSIGDDLGNVALLPWVITVELLAAAIAVLGIGPIVDSQGVQRVFRVAMIAFIAASVACAAAPTMPLLIAGRVGQGIAAGGVLGSAISSIGLAYEESLRPRAYAAISAVWGIMGIGGPAIAAGLISVLGWRSLFTVSVPVGVIATAIGWNHLPGPRAGSVTERRFDRRGLAVVAMVTTGLLLAASSGSSWGWLWLGFAIMAGAVYIRHARTHTDPVVRLNHLVSIRWRYMHITSTMAVAGGTGATAFLPVYLRGARGASEGRAAFSVLFVVIGWSIAAFVASKAQERFHAAHVVQAGSTILCTGAISATAIAAFEWPIAVLLAALFFMGSGVGTITTGGLTLLQGRASAQEMGRVTSAHQFLRSLGFAYGAAVGGAVLFFVIASQIDDVEAIRDLLGGEDGALNDTAVAALQDGFVWALAATAIFTVIAVVSAYKLVRTRHQFADPILLTHPV
jgi:MFS family permease